MASSPRVYGLALDKVGLWVLYAVLVLGPDSFLIVPTCSILSRRVTGTMNVTVVSALPEGSQSQIATLGSAIVCRRSAGSIRLFCLARLGFAASLPLNTTLLSGQSEETLLDPRGQSVPVVSGMTISPVVFLLCRIVIVAFSSIGLLGVIWFAGTSWYYIFPAVSVVLGLFVSLISRTQFDQSVAGAVKIRHLVGIASLIGISCQTVYSIHIARLSVTPEWGPVAWNVAWALCFAIVLVESMATKSN